MTRKTFPSLLGLFAVVLSMVAIGILAGCGGSVPPKDVATVRAYTDWAGNPSPHAESLGWTYWSDGDGAKYGVPGYNSLINEMTLADPDDDRIVRVIVVEILNAQVLRAGAYPAGLDGGWYLWSSENRDPYEALGPAESAWVASLPRMTVHVHPRDPWLVEPTRAAVDRLNAGGAEVFVLEGVQAAP